MAGKYMLKRLKNKKSISSEKAAELSLCAKEQFHDAVCGQIIETLKLPAEYSEIADSIGVHGCYILRISHDMNEYYNALAGISSPAEIKSDIAAALYELCTKSEKIISKRKINLTYFPPAEPVYIRTDLERFHYAVLNLLLNAVENTPEDGKIRVSLTKTRSFAKITITDSGAGMDEETLSLCFEPFFTKNLFPGRKKMGLGLTLARFFAKSSGGRISIKSIPEKGTAVSLFLPLPKDDFSLSAESSVPDIPEGKISPVDIVFSGLFISLEDYK